MKRKFVLALMAFMAMLGAKADGPFRNARWDSFHCLKPAGTDIVFVGNSITNMHQWWEALGGQNNVLNRGTSGGFTTEVLSNLEAITAGHPKKVFIGIGTNDICEVLSLETTADNVRIIAERIARECPETEVYIQSLIPSTSDGNHVAGGGRNGRVLQVNALIQAHAEALAAKGLKVTYLDVNTPLRDPNNPNALKTSKFGQKIAFDDLHPNAVGYKYWLDTIKEETGYDCIYEEKEMPRPMNNNVYDDCLSGFEQFKISGDDILMVGGDMIHNGEWHEFMKSGHFKNRGMGWGLYGITIANLNTIVERSLAADGSEDPKAIVIYAGDKDSNNGTAAATQFEAYKTAIEGIKAKAPTSKIFVLSAMPNTDNTKNGIVQELNSKMKAYAAQGDYTFVDAYAEIATNRQLYMNNTGYVYTRGYAKIAQVLAESLNDKLGTDYEPISDDEAADNVDNYNARTTLGNAITSALRLSNDKYKGDAIGQYSAANYGGLDAALTASFSLLNSNYTAEQLSAQATTLANTVPAINKPTAELVAGKQWQIIAQRGNRYVSSNGVGQGVTGKEANNQNYSRWTLSQREEGSWNFQNVDDASYLVPASGNTNQLVTSASVPDLGWTFEASQTPGTFIISSGGIQLHTLNSYNIANWGGGSNTNDEGCKFKLVEIEGAPDIISDIPEPGKVFTVYNDHAGTPYYLANTSANVAGKTDLTPTLATDGSEKWIAWGSTESGYEFINAANGAKVTSHNNFTAFDVDQIKASIGLSLFEHGTQRHIGGTTKTLTLAGGMFTKNASNNAVFNEFVNNNTGDKWSTDFVFLATGENAYKVEGGSVTVAGTNYTDGQFVVTEGTLSSSDITVAEEGKIARINNNVINVSDEVGPIAYTICADFNGRADSRYLVINNGALSTSTTAPTSDDGYWYIGEDYVQNVSNSKYLGVNGGFYLSDNKVTLSFANGKIKGSTICESTRNGAIKTDGTISGGQFTGKTYNEGDWSADFIFTEVPDDTDETTFVSERVIHLSDIVPGAKIAMKVNVSGQNNGFYAIPNGNADTETWFTVAEGSTSSTLRLMTADGKYVGTSTTKYVEAADALDFVVTAEGDNTANAKYIFKNTDSTHGITLENNASLPAAYWALGGAPRLRFEVYKQTVAGPAGFDGTYTISSNTGTLYHTNGSANQSYNAVWKSSKTPQLQFGCGVNNMRYSGTDLELMTGQSGKSTYTITAPAGYVITGYSFNYANNNHDSALNFTHNGVETQTTREAQRISVEDVEIKNASFTIDGDNARGILLTEFVVTIEPFTAKPPVVSTEGDVKWYYIVNASSKDYCRDKVMYYEPDGNRMKFADKAFDARYIWSFWRGDNGKLAIKNYKGEYIGTAGSGQGGNTAFGMSDEPNYIYSIDPSNGFLTIGDGALPLHAQQSGSLIVRWAAEADGASLWRFEKADITHADATLSTTLVQQGKISTGRGNKNVPIIRSTMKVSGLEGNVTFSGVKGKVTGTNLADITKVQAYFATDNRELHVADSRMEWRNSNAVLYGTAASIGTDGQFTITGENKTLEPGNYYLWLTLDVAENATEGNKVDAQITGYTIDGAEAPEANGNPQYEATVFLSEGTVLMAGDGKFGSKYFRIPAITTTADGKRLVTLTDDRLNHNGDLPSHVYITAQYSDDNGQTWSEPKIVAGEEATGGNYAHGDAQIITNRVNGDIVGIMTCATNGQGFWGSSPERPQTWKTIISHDNGETWTVPVDHTKELYAAGSPNPLWKGGFSGSGAGLQKRDGTLVSPFVNRDENGNRQFVLFESVDAGQSWHVAGKPCMIGQADEPKVLERNNGDLAISVRATGRNFHNETSDNGLTWNHPVDTRFTTGISGNACDGEYMVWCSTLDGNERNIAFQTVPNNGSRQNVSIALSLDEGETFLDPKTICPRGSAYSAATVLADGTLGVYYEEVGVNDGYTMRFVRFSLDWASDHKYGFTAEKPYKRYTSLQAIVNAILKNVYKGVTVGNAANEIKHLTDAAE